MSSTDGFRQFAAQARARGFDEVLERRWEPGTVLDTHTHPFAVDARVVQGEMWLSVGGQTQHLRPGDPFVLDAHVPHAERYGTEGATYWVARRNA
jgi:mannose-6-phosphate isomerase-like protein (cupin superfamily)